MLKIVTQKPLSKIADEEGCSRAWLSKSLDFKFSCPSAIVLRLKVIKNYESKVIEL